MDGNLAATPDGARLRYAIGCALLVMLLCSSVEAPGQGAEIKATMAEGVALTYD
jgi:hypothetical protein